MVSSALLMPQRCCYFAGMGVAVTIRDVPEDVRDELAARAARSGRSLQEYLRLRLIDEARRPAIEDILARARRRARSVGTQVGTDEILAARDADRR
jgi:plasmid stability protein